MPATGSLVLLLSFLSLAFAGDDSNQNIPLSVAAGSPLRLYLTKKVGKRAGAPVQAKTLEPLFAFDREVVPVGTDVLGRVSRVQPVPKWQRFRAILGGDFTPLHRAQIEFTTLSMPDGRQLPIQTVETEGLNSIFVPPSPKKKKTKQPKAGQNPTSGVLGTGKQTLQDQINGQINARTRGIADIVRAPNKKEKLYDMLWAKLPYHPQSVRRGTRFDAELRDPLSFGSVGVPKDAFALLGSQPAADSVVHARLLAPLDSATAKTGQEVGAVMTQPLFSSEHKLVLPEGTHVTGVVVVARRARWFHRGGQLRFSFQRVDLPEEAMRLRPDPSEAAPLRTQATLAAAEGSGKAPIKVDQEGGVQATESKTRFIAPMISILIANKSLDNDAERHSASGGAAESNVSGRTLGGASGFGLLGTLAAQSSRYVGTAFGIYGMAWSVYSNVVARGGEVEFAKNAVLDIRFGARKLPPAAKFRAGD